MCVYLSVCLSVCLCLSLTPSLSLSLTVSPLSPFSLPPFLFLFLFVPLTVTNDVQRVVVTLSQVSANVFCVLVSGSDARGCSVSISIDGNSLIEQNISQQVTKYLSDTVIGGTRT